ncbi:hypothetical protein HMPREF9971_1069 [Streptococcus parasanguinis F0449]|uniref:Uncharacterized protein n=1 Tax=Streptococcus parasanguinis F0449 TaxID=1095733 RepID=I2NGV7_STRPA|nr:hypothetical protein HMPREF9971_1069 [Streptococcus parasanguinis F0449]
MSSISILLHLDTIWSIKAISSPHPKTILFFFSTIWSSLYQKSQKSLPSDFLYLDE